MKVLSAITLGRRRKVSTSVEKQIKKEAIISISLCIFYFLWWYGFGYGLGDKDPSSYNYVFGLPEWFFYSCILGFIILSFGIYICVALFFKDIPLYEKKTPN